MEIVSIDLSRASDMARLHASGFDHSWPEQDFIDHIERETDGVMGVNIDGQLRGFIITRIALDQAEILTVVIDTNYQRQGLGLALITAVEKDIKKKGAEILFLEVAQDNVAAISLYENNGYVCFARRPGYYRRTVKGKTILIGAHLMQKRL